MTFLAPNMLPVYQYITGHVSKMLNLKTELLVGTSYHQISKGEADIYFVCGLPYVKFRQQKKPPVIAIAAPVLQGERYQNKPIYFSDVIVSKDKPYRTFGDLRGSSWAYNETESQSGYGITLYTLSQMGETSGFFSRVIKAGFHQKAIQMVAKGEVEASAIDSQVLSIEMRDDPDLKNHIKIIDSLGPSTIQPVAVSTKLDEELVYQIQSVFLELGKDSRSHQQLVQGYIDHFVTVQDSTYDDIRYMLAKVNEAKFLRIK